MSKYSEPTGLYRVKVMAGDNWRLFDNARIGISLGHKGTTGKRLYALLEWAIPRFKSVLVDLYDAQHAYNVGEERANAAAQEWLINNRDILDQFNVEVVRTSTVTTDMSTLPLADPHFERMVKSDIESAWCRKLIQLRGREHKLPSFEEFVERSRNYILSEMAYMVTCPDPYIDIYPGDPLNCLVYLTQKNPDIGILKVDYRVNGAMETALNAVEAA